MLTADKTQNAEGINCCDKCSGRGRVAPFGVCYQCEGKGYMTAADDRRTAAYWAHRFASEMRHSCRMAEAAAGDPDYDC